MKQCSKCKLFKEFSAFGIRNKSKDGLTPICKKCKSENGKEYYGRTKKNRTGKELSTIEEILKKLEPERLRGVRHIHSKVLYALYDGKRTIHKQFALVPEGINENIQVK